MPMSPFVDFAGLSWTASGWSQRSCRQRTRQYGTSVPTAPSGQLVE